MTPTPSLLSIAWSALRVAALAVIAGEAWGLWDVLPGRFP